MDVRSLEAAFTRSLKAESELGQLLKTVEVALEPQAGKPGASPAGEPDLAGLHALRRAFVRHLSAGNIPVKAKAKVEEEVQVKTSGKSSLKRPLPPDNSASAEAARAGLARYQTLLLKGLSHQDAVVKLACLRALMDLIGRTPARRLDGDGPLFRFSPELMIRIIQEIVCKDDATLDTDVTAALIGEYADVYDDVRYFLLKSVKYVSATKSELESGNAASHSLPKDKGTRAMIDAKAEAVAARSVALLLQVNMPSSESELTGKTLGPQPAKVAPAAAAAGGAKKHKKGDKSGKDAAAAEVVPEESKCLSLHWQKRTFSEAWLATLQLPLNKDTYHLVLQSLPKAIIPNLVNPLMLCDFLTDSFSVGGVVSLMALDGLWTLMQKHGLDYPDFYSKLYSLLTLETLHAEYRTDFFKKLDMFLSSGYLASYIAAAFAKRMARLAIRSEPPVILFAIPFVYNIIQSHPALTKMIHHRDSVVHRYRPKIRVRINGGDLDPIPTFDPADDDGGTEFVAADDAAPAAAKKEESDEEEEEEEEEEDEEEKDDKEADEEDEEEAIAPPIAPVVRKIPSGPLTGPGVDVFDPITNDVSKCRAQDSSLWELTVLQCHYNPTISTLVKSFSSKWNAARKPVERSAGASYSSMLKVEMNRKLKAATGGDNRPTDNRWIPNVILGDD